MKKLSGLTILIIVLICFSVLGLSTINEEKKEKWDSCEEEQAELELYDYDSPLYQMTNYLFMNCLMDYKILKVKDSAYQTLLLILIILLTLSIKMDKSIKKKCGGKNEEKRS